MSQHPLAYLARRFPQLYVEPSDYSEEAYKRAFTRGEAPENASLDHFHTTPDDWLRICETPSGEVEALFLANRDDFETFLRCVLYRAQRRTISPTVGAMTIAGLPDWEVLRAKQHELMEEYGENWAEEYRAFIGEPDKYKITMLLLSEGPNSNVPAGEVGLSEDEWLERSREIRLYHELAHVVCRRLLPDDILPVWDEVTADFHGILRAFGAYDATLALRYIHQNPDVTVVIPGMYDVKEIEQNLAAMEDNSPLSEKEIAQIEEIRKTLGTQFCRRCNYCQPCSVGINISGTFLMEGYLDRYGLGDWAKSRYATFPKKAGDCIGCGVCETRCPYQLPIRAMLARCKEKFGA